MQGTHRGDGEDAATLPAGTQVGAYVLEAVLGSGGFGITYRARHATLNKQFALKEYFPHQFCYRQQGLVAPGRSASREYAWGLDRFIKEAQALAKFKHAAIVDVSDIFVANNTAYMVLAYENAPSFGAWLDALGRAPTQQELDRIVGPLLDALERVHGAGMLHRDIAPDNILVRADGTPVLIDFGAAREDLKHRAGPVTAVIKPGYSPPEQYEATSARQGPWSDIYGFGATLYYAVAGALPFSSEERFDARVRSEAAKRARGTYRQNFLAAIDWAMAFDPSARPQTVGQWRQRLLAPDAHPDVPDDTRPSGASRRGAAALSPRARGNRRRQSAKLGGLIALVVCALAALALPWRCALLGWGCPSAPLAHVEPLRLEIALANNSYAIGERMSFSLKANRACYFLIYTVSPSGDVEPHEPAENTVFMGSPLLGAEAWRRIPVNGFATIKPPPGTFELGAICSTQPLASIGLSDAELRGPAQAGRRSFYLALDNAAKRSKQNDFARATVGYEVRQ
jgi:hypothetical protein